MCGIASIESNLILCIGAFFSSYKMSFVQGFILGIKYSNLSKHLKTPWHRENGEHSTQHIAFTTKCRKASSGLHVVHEKSAPF